MTKKDYELIASVFFACYSDSELYPDSNHVYRLALDMAEALQYQNNKFDREKFLTACGIKE